MSLLTKDIKINQDHLIMKMEIKEEVTNNQTNVEVMDLLNPKWFIMRKNKKKKIKINLKIKNNLNQKKKKF